MAKPFDRIFKTLAEDDPRGMLHLFGSLPLDAEASVQIVDREIGLPVLSVDHVYCVAQAGREWLAHFEVQTQYKSDVPERLTWYAAALALKFKMAVDTVLILLNERKAPKKVPTGHRIKLGSAEIAVDYRVIKLWEMDPDIALNSSRPDLLPWVALMRASEEQWQQAVKSLTALHNEKLLTQCFVLGGMRYDKSYLAEVLGRSADMITREMIEESSFTELVMDWGIEKGLVKGMEKGIQEGIMAGRIEQARRSIRIVAATRFSSIGSLPEIDSLDDLEQLESLFNTIVLAPDEAALRAAVTNATT